MTVDDSTGIKLITKSVENDDDNNLSVTFKKAINSIKNQNLTMEKRKYNK